MSWNQLPGELKQHIVTHVAASDRRYKDRMQKDNLENDQQHRSQTPSYALSKELRGRGIMELSRVSQDCRALCLPLLFSVLKATKALTPIFQYGMLQSVVGETVRELVIDYSTREQELPLILYHICPRLSNLTSIVFEKEILESLFPIASPRQFNNELERMNFAQLVDVAKGIEEWTFRISNLKRISPFVEANAPRIRKLDLWTATCFFHRIGEDNPVDTISNLPPLPSLSHLSLGLAPRPRDQLPLINPPCLEYNYAFLSTLTSLTLTISTDQPRPTPIDASLLHFASVFPSLQYLHLDANSTSLDNAKTFLLPRLLRLELSLTTLVSCTAVLQHLKLPSVRYLSLLFPTKIEPPMTATEKDYDTFPTLVPRILRLQPSLRTLYLLGRTGHADALTSDLKTSLKRASKTPLTFGIEIDSHCEDDPTVWDEPPEGTTAEEWRQQALDSSVDRIAYLGHWLIERSETLEREDGAEEAKALAATLKEIDEYRIWLEE